MGSRYNELMMRPHVDNLPYLQPPSGEPDEPSVELTVGYCVIDALLSSYPDKKNDQKPAYVSGNDKVRRYEMAQRVRESMDSDTDFDMLGGDQQYLMGLMEQKWTTDIYGQCHKIIYRNGTHASSDIDN